MEKRLGLRTKALLLLLPLVIAIVGLSGAFAFLTSRNALTRVASRLMAYKAEQLRDFAYSQWEVIEDLGFAEDDEYRAAAEAAIQSYASSLLRNETELILALSSTGSVVMTTSRGLAGSPAEAYPELVITDEPNQAGWFESPMEGAVRLGQRFHFEPFDWSFYVTELRSVFYTDVREITTTHGAILAVSVLLATLLISFLMGVIVRPLERLTNAMRLISDSGDPSQVAEVEYADEVGILAQEFNAMTGSLQQTLEAEEAARRTALDREEETLLVLARASEFRDVDTGAHLERVGALCAEVGRLFGMEDEERRLLRRSAPLHDIGKIGIPDTILFNPGKLTREEYDEMKRHTLIGWNILRECRSVYLRHGAEIALSHHEHWDGTGYPQALRGEDIPLAGRIVGLVDVYDALTSERPYKRAWSAEEARDYIQQERGRHFDPRLVDLFVSSFDAIRARIDF